MEPIRVLVVDDSALVRRLVATALQPAADIEVVGMAEDGLAAVRQVEALRPDVVTLDIEMPHLDGLGALDRIRERHPRLPVIMFSTLTERGATATLDALSRGASDYVTKPSNTGRIADGIEAVREQLVPRIRALAGMRQLTARSAAAATDAAATVPRLRPASPARAGAPAPVGAVLIGCSTGGPDALARLLPMLPADLGVPVLVVQHMPPVFTAQLASRLDKLAALPVAEAVDGEPVLPGRVLIAPGDFHLEVGRRAGVVRVSLGQGPQENFCRPAVDVLFRSAVQAYSDVAAVAAVVLTGMGQDGLVGCRAVADAGGRILVQDEASSVVWGMPGAVAHAGLADGIGDLGDLAAGIVSAVRGSRIPA